MSKLEELIQQYCPDGVEWKTLGEVCDIHKGVQFNKTDMKDVGTYPVINGGINPSGYAEVFNEEKDTITISQGGASAGYVNFLRNKFWLGAHCYAVIPYDIVLNKYLYHFIKMNEITLQQCQYGAGIPALAKSTISSLEIPVPPLPVQEEIVRILDNFTELQAELQAELQKRKLQYNYYLDNLLNFNRGGYQAEVRWMKMSDIGAFYSGLSGKTKEDFQNGNAKFISYVNIFNNPSLITDVDDRVKILEGEKQNTIQYGDLLFTGSSETPDECGMCSVLTHHTEEKLYLNSFCFGFRFNDLSGINPEFMKFLFRSSVIRKLICKTANGVTRFNISKKEFAKIVIPIPSLAEQDHIASVLDKFYFLVGDLSSGLPAEMEKRRQQYEYYRDRLLTFKRKGA